MLPLISVLLTACFLQLLAALLHLGNVEFVSCAEDAEAAAVADAGAEAMVAAAQLLGVEVSELTRVLVTRMRLTPDGEHSCSCGVEWG